MIRDSLAEVWDWVKWYLAGSKPAAEVCTVCGDTAIFAWVEEGKRAPYCKSCYPTYLRRPPVRAFGKAGL